MNSKPTKPTQSFKIACSFCGGNDHHINNCPEVCCRKCNKLGHTAKVCKAKTIPQSIDPPPVECNYCRKEGHHINYCPKVICRRCGEGGHTAKVCKNPAHNYTLPTCRRCLRHGHTEEFCWKCGKCGEYGHTTDSCYQKTKSKTKSKNTIFDESDFPSLVSNTNEEDVLSGKIHHVTIEISGETVNQLKDLGVEIPDEFGFSDDDFNLSDEDEIISNLDWLDNYNENESWADMMDDEF